MDIGSKTHVVGEIPLFAGLAAPELEAIARQARERLLEKGEELFHQGDPSTHNYVVAWGRLRLDQTTPEGQNVVISHLGAGDLVGTVAVVRDVPFPATPTAVEDTMVLSWTRAELLGQMERHPSVAANVIRTMGGRLEDLQARLREVATQRVERRIAASLLRLVRQSGRRTAEGVEIPFPLSRQELAEMNATTLHTVSRTLSGWQQVGILSGRRASHILILKPHRLVQIAEEA
jgi:CRP-like cAMP-binding protein